MKYFISYTNPLTHLVNISLEVDHVSEDIVHLQLPSWRPGRYEIVNFAKNLLSIEALDNNDNNLKISKISKDRWAVSMGKNTFVKISYIYYAHEMDAGNSWLDDEQLYLNFINCMIYAEGRQRNPCLCELNLPGDYQIATGLVEKQKHILWAESYYQLVDSPMIASNQLDHHQYVVRGTTFHIWVQGTHQLDIEKMLFDFERFTITQLNVMGDFPCSNYHFLIQALPYKHYHGVEHQNSTTITLGPSNELNNASLYHALLGISSHELFHTWNVIRIRPLEMSPYDYSKENYFDTGYVAEGFTTYYGDLFLVRSGVLDIEWYFNKLNKMLQRHFENFGRGNMSVAESSLDLWLDGYVSGIPNRKVSIYNEGAIVALILDLLIRVLSNHKKSLDDLMRILWAKYGKTHIGYNSDSILKTLQDLVDYNWIGFFDNYIYGTTPIEELFSTLLEHFSFILTKTQSTVKNESYWGFRVDEEHCITKIQPKSIAEEKLSIGDRVLNLTEVLSLGTPDIELKIERNCKKSSVTLSNAGGLYFEGYLIKEVQRPSPVQKDATEKWLCM